MSFLRRPQETEKVTGGSISGILRNTMKMIKLCFIFQRAFTVGIGGPVGSGKTALTLALCRHLRDSYGVCVVTNDIFTR